MALRFDAGRVCLDLLATGHPREQLVSVGALCAWIQGAGIVPAGTALEHADASWLGQFREVRGHVQQLVRPGGGDTAAYRRALVRVNELAAAAPPAPRAVRCGTRPSRIGGRCAAIRTRSSTVNWSSTPGRWRHG